MHRALHVINLGGVLATEPSWGFLAESEILCRQGSIVAIGDDLKDEAGAADGQDQHVTVLDAAGLIAIPGLIDGHVHPVVGSVSVVPPGWAWTDAYLNAGVTACISAGELTLPGFDALRLTPDMAAHVAVTSAWAYGNLLSPPRVFGGTLLAVPGLERRHFMEVADAGGRCLKYIYYPFRQDSWQLEVAQYNEWAKEFRLATKMHAGGTSYQGHSVETDAALVLAVAPDILAHANGGPIPLPDSEVSCIIEESNCYIELILGGNLRLLASIVRKLRERNELHRVTVGTDTPGGNGIMPRGLLQVLAAISALGDVDAATALRCGTDNVARAHGVPGGALRVGEPANLLLVGPVRGSGHTTVSGAIESGELLGVGAVICDGVLVASPGRYTPPPASVPVVSS